MTDLHPLVVAERRTLADALEPLTPEQWATPSLCAGWSTRDVVAHLVWPAEHNALDVFRNFVKSRFNLERFTTMTAQADKRSGAEIVGVLRATADHRWTPPGFSFEAPLTDTVTHGRDICRPLGIRVPLDPVHARAVLDFATSAKATRGFVRKGRLDGLEFTATDLDWSVGAGEPITGPAEDLILAILGRRIALDALSGAGVETLRSRI